jgi:hypothetical protein
MERAKIVRKRHKNSISAMLITAVAAISLAAFARSSHFAVTRLQLEGLTSYTELTRQDAFAAADLALGMNIFSFSARKAEKGIMSQIPQVKSAKVSRRLPGAVSIRIVEREPFSCIYYEGVYYLCDEDGFVMSASGVIGPPGCISISGLSDIAIYKGTSFRFSQNAQTLTVKAVLDFIASNSLASKISEITLERNEYYIYTNNNNYIRFFALSDFSENEAFVIQFLTSELRANIMVELFDGADPIYKMVGI